ncbi:hypothetical protein PHET_07629 [Paragonimus heterotremus]|uniref:Uncharacterized protein n=1 Tax=Paragonimus heterotremus TaxID=100268 RepID=A0A8J4SMP7_9TREM|nr:hypothetical protein PHET_07629 [Paragonimus heterotremus]
MLDFLLTCVTCSFWISFLWSGNLRRNTKYPPDDVGNPSSRSVVNPFIKQLTNTNYPGTYQTEFVSNLQTAVNLVDVQLLIQIAGSLLYKCWDRIAPECRYSVHVYRAVDGLSRNYTFGLTDITSLASSIIQSVSLEPRVNEPLRAKRKRRLSRQSKASDSNRSHQSSALTTSTNVPDSLSQLNCNKSRVAFRRHLERADAESADRNSYKIYAVDNSVTTPHSESKNEIRDQYKKEKHQDDCHMVCLKAPDLHLLHKAATERSRVQSNYDRLIRIKQLRLHMLLKNCMLTIGLMEMSAVERGGQWDRGARIEEAAKRIYEKISGPLTKYLRFTGQQHIFPLKQVQERLTFYLSCNMSAAAFLQLYFVKCPKLVRNAQSETLTLFINQSKRKTTTVSTMKSGCFHWQDLTNHSTEDELTQNSHTTLANVRRMPGNPNKKSDDHQVYQTWKFRLHHTNFVQPHTTQSRSLLTSFIYHGLKFELSRADVVLVCTVCRYPVFELKNVTPSDKPCNTLRLQNGSLPASTVESCVASSGNFGEIRL